MTDLDALKAQLDAAQASYGHILQVVWGLVAFEVALVAAVLVHELGHAAMTRCARLQVRMVRIGMGPALLRLRLGRAWFVVRLRPVSGAVLALVPQTTTLAGAARFLLGGMGANAVLLTGLVSIWMLLPGTGWRSAPAAAQVVVILTAAVPCRWRHHGQDSDGMRLLRLRREGVLWSASQNQAAMVRRLGLTEPVPPPSSA